MSVIKLLRENLILVQGNIIVGYRGIFYLITDQIIVPLTLCYYLVLPKKENLS